MQHNIGLDDERTLSVQQFCELEGLTLTQFETLRKKGWAPEMLCLDDGIDRITSAARRAWHRRIAAMDLMLSNPAIAPTVDGRRYIDGPPETEDHLEGNPVGNGHQYQRNRD